MSDQFVAEIRITAFNFAPIGWAFCNGQLLPISQNAALFSLLGTTYGGDGRTNFALPNLQGNAPIQPGQGPGLSLYNLGQTGGEQTVTLLNTQIPAHSHAVIASSSPATNPSPSGDVWAVAGSRRAAVNEYTATSTPVTMNPSALSPTGGNLPHNNMPPYLALNFIIALQGVFPPRS